MSLSGKHGDCRSRGAQFPGCRLGILCALQLSQFSLRALPAWEGKCATGPFLAQPRERTGPGTRGWGAATGTAPGSLPLGEIASLFPYPPPAGGLHQACPRLALHSTPHPSADAPLCCHLSWGSAGPSADATCPSVPWPPASGSPQPLSSAQHRTLDIG